MSHHPWHLTVLLAALAAFVPTIPATFQPKQPIRRTYQMRPDTRATIRTLAPHSLTFRNLFLRDSTAVQGRVISADSVPTRERAWALKWIQQVIRSDWRPADLPGTLVALKDVKQEQRRDFNGVVVPEIVGDYIVSEYTIRGHHFHLYDSGVTLSVLVLMPRTVDVTRQPDAAVTQWLTMFLNLPGNIGIPRSSLRQEGAFFHAFVRPGGRDVDWWNWLELCTDGDFFFVSCPEPATSEDTGKLIPQASPRLPDRF